MVNAQVTISFCDHRVLCLISTPLCIASEICTNRKYWIQHGIHGYKQHHATFLLKRKKRFDWTPLNSNIYVCTCKLCLCRKISPFFGKWWKITSNSFFLNDRFSPSRNEIVCMHISFILWEVFSGLKRMGTDCGFVHNLFPSRREKMTTSFWNPENSSSFETIFWQAKSLFFFAPTSHPNSSPTYNPSLSLRKLIEGGVRLREEGSE